MLDRRAFVCRLAVASPALLGTLGLPAPAGAAELLPRTVAAFDRYVQATERGAVDGSCPAAPWTARWPCCRTTTRTPPCTVPPSPGPAYCRAKGRCSASTSASS